MKNVQIKHKEYSIFLLLDRHFLISLNHRTFMVATHIYRYPGQKSQLRTPVHAMVTFSKIKSIKEAVKRVGRFREHIFMIFIPFRKRLFSIEEVTYKNIH